MMSEASARGGISFGEEKTKRTFFVQELYDKFHEKFEATKFPQTETIQLCVLP